ncbi:phosphopantetheine adenylyltransferase [Natronococcus pandeyae]|uniref:Phosphopantetheine adenylyltransferase n=1 Tax=Natronococcus pandeyae TaxID=2055836 RepID=A0A8J8Q397_9EURY|nr:pantetheine-phosphate adenylyltransferase [Natronococcus pandeyae]TYL38596.1 phosphopantetheine adenylyltransferase [Natronococcus pandeyae]
MRVAVAGTFGPIHDGHRLLLDHALRFGEEHVIVGLTSDELAVETRSVPRPIPSHEERKQSLESVIDAIDEWDRDVTISELDDPQGIISDDPAIDALVTSPETVDELEAVNETRRERGFDPLTGIVAPYVLAEDGDRISSTRIVRGEIDEHGAVLEQGDDSYPADTP